MLCHTMHVSKYAFNLACFILNKSYFCLRHQCRGGQGVRFWHQASTVGGLGVRCSGGRSSWAGRGHASAPAAPAAAAPPARLARSPAAPAPVTAPASTANTHQVASKEK